MDHEQGEGRLYAEYPPYRLYRIKAKKRHFGVGARLLPYMGVLYRFSNESVKGGKMPFFGGEIGALFFPNTNARRNFSPYIGYE